jgi:4'-phosphopantetheinyl transferase
MHVLAAKMVPTIGQAMIHVPSLTARLQRGEIHIWQKRLDDPVDVAPELESLLSPSERVRGASYRLPRDGHRFIVARAFLRRMLALYLVVDPRQIRFSRQSHGKPVLTGVRTARDLRFNVSSSADRAAVAVAWQREVGVDLERIRPDFGFEDIVDQFFSAAERSALRACPSAGRADAFFHAWVRKEAYLKARGEGLDRALSSFDVPITPDAASPAAASAVLAGEDLSRGTLWFVREVPTEPGFALAVCAPHKDWSAINIDDVHERLKPLAVSSRS